MRDLLELQLAAIESLQNAEEETEVLINTICSIFCKTDVENAALRKALRALVETSILYGRVTIRHEILLKDEQENT